MKADYKTLTISEAHSLIQKKEITVKELTEASIKRIDEKDEALNAFITVSRDSARKQAEQCDKNHTQENGLLFGIPYAHKDVVCTKGIKTTAGSNVLKSYEPPYSATVEELLQKEQGVMIGKTNLDEFTMGASNETSAFGPVKNPWNHEYVAGGSSGGSAAAVASGEVIYAIGTDTGGSIRQPAGFCGVVGMKPTYGRVSRYGIASMASSLDTIGTLTKTVADAAITLEVIAGQDKKDATTIQKPVPQYLQHIHKDIKGKTIGIWKEAMELEGLDEEVKEDFEQNVQNLKDQGANIKEISLPHAKYGVAVYYVIMPSEVSSNMARYEGLRYGTSKDQAESLMDFYIKNRTEGFGAEVKRRIMLGTYILSAGYYDAYYKQAQRVRTIIRNEFAKQFTQHGIDAIISPTSPTAAFKLGEKTEDPLQMYLADIFTAPANIAGIPAISVPSGKTKSGLPMALQIMGPQLGEEDILNIAFQFEQSRQ